MFAGTFAANADISIEVRAIRADGLPLVAMTADVSTGSATNQPVEQLDFDFPDFVSQDSIEWQIFAYGTPGNGNGIRLDDIAVHGDSATLPAGAVHHDVYLIGGQSNANGRGDSAELPPALANPQNDVGFYFHTTQNVTNLGHLQEDQWISLAPGAGHGTGAPVSDREFGLEVTFGRTLADTNPNRNISIIKYSEGGTNLHDEWSATLSLIHI